MLLGYPPFCGKTPSVTLNNVLHFEQNFKIPSDAKLSVEAVDLLKKLIARAEKRLGRNGVQEIKSHPFFKGFNWQQVRNRPAPIIPKLANDEDTCNFEKFEMNSVWNPVFRVKDQNQRNEGVLFIGYTYKKPVSLDSTREVEEIFENLRRKREAEGKRNYSAERITTTQCGESSAKSKKEIKFSDFDSKKQLNFAKKPRVNDCFDRNTGVKANDQLLKNFTVVHTESGSKYFKTDAKKPNTSALLASAKPAEKPKIIAKDSDPISRLANPAKAVKTNLLALSKLYTQNPVHPMPVTRKPITFANADLSSKLKYPAPSLKTSIVQSAVRTTLAKPTLSQVDSSKSKPLKASDKNAAKAAPTFLKLKVFSSIKNKQI
jgi:hypothetical protein